MTTAQTLISRSISHSEIARAESTAELQAAMSAACDDYTRTDTVIDYWGTDDGYEWRVHLAL